MVRLLAVLVLAGASVCKGITLFPVGFETGWDAEDFIKIDNPNNVATLNGNGIVSYVYFISKKEVSNDQYALFLNEVAKTSDNSGFLVSNDSSFKITRNGISGGYSYSVASGFGGVAVRGISPAASTMYINWLANFSGSKNTTTGSYQVTNDWQGRFSPRNTGASIFLPNPNETLKAMYFNTASDVWMTGWSNPNNLYNADSLPNEFVELSKEGGYLIGDQVKLFYTRSEISLSLAQEHLYPGSSNYNGNWVGFTQNNMADVGFRVATTLSNVPEPSSLSLLLAGGAVLMAGRRRRV